MEHPTSLSDPALDTMEYTGKSNPDTEGTGNHVVRDLEHWEHSGRWRRKPVKKIMAVFKYPKGSQMEEGWDFALPSTGE